MRARKWGGKLSRWGAFALLAAALLLAQSGSRADDAPVRVKRVEAMTEPLTRLPRNLNYAAVKRKWSLEAWWAVTTTRQNMYEKTNVGSGMFIALMSPELIAALTARQAQNS